MEKLEGSSEDIVSIPERDLGPLRHFPVFVCSDLLMVSIPERDLGPLRPYGYQKALSSVIVSIPERDLGPLRRYINVFEDQTNMFQSLKGI